MKIRAAAIYVTLAISFFISARAWAAPDWVNRERAKARGTTTEISVKKETLVVEYKEVEMKDETTGRKYNGAEEIDWRERYIQVTAEGMDAECESEAECRIKSEKIARVRAYVLLAEAIAGVSVTDDTTVNDEVRLSSISTTKLNAFIKSARIVDTRWIKIENKIVCLLTLGILLDAPDGLSAILLGGLKEREEKEQKESAEEIGKPINKAAAPEAELEPEPEARPEPGDQIAESDSYSGLIIDARGTGMRPCMSPQIVTKEGEVVYGLIKIDADYAVRVGIAGYLNDPEEAKSEARVGKNPMVIKAEGITGALKSYAVVSNADSANILQADKKSGFLSKCAVVFIID